jgi:chitinase
VKHRALALALVTSSLLSFACGDPSAEDADSQDYELSAQQCASATAFVVPKLYAVGSIVTFKGGVFRCQIAHTSQADWTPDVAPALWLKESCAGQVGGGGGAQPPAPPAPPAKPPAQPPPQQPPANGGGANNGGGGAQPPPPPPPTNGAKKFFFGPYKDTGINLAFGNVISTRVAGQSNSFANELARAGGKTAYLAFATGECGNESWGAISGAAMAAANVKPLNDNGLDYVLSTGGAAGVFTCGSDAGFSTFVDRWMSPHLVGIDFDIEAGQTPQIISDLIKRIKTARDRYPNLRFSLTLATVAQSKPGAATAQAFGAGAPDGLNVLGDNTISAVRNTFGFNGSAQTWPSFITVNLMTMDFGGGSSFICVLRNGLCQMGESSLQAALNLRDHFGIPLSNVEITPMIGGNDVQANVFTLADADTVARFALANGLAGVHYWSFDRDVDCPPGPASATCNTLGNAGTLGFLRRFLAAGLR